MNTRAVRLLAWSLGLLESALAVASLFLLAVEHAEPPSASVYSWIGDMIWSASPVAFATAGTLIALRLPRNPIGWLLIATGFANAGSAFVQPYAVYVVMLHPGSLPGPLVAVWLSNWLWLAVWPFIIVLLLLFPDGRLLSRRWRVIAGLSVPLSLVAIADAAIYPGPVPPFDSVQNPLGLTGSSGQVLQQVGQVPFYLPVLLVFVASLASLILRLTRVKGDQREQLKWLVYAGALACAVQLLWAFNMLGDWAIVVSALSIYAIPIPIGIAILRYRLYDIDLIIRRTVVFAALTGFLASAYFGSVVVLQQLFHAITGQGSDLAIVASTLAIAALFQPLRRRIQTFIDRRFYRRKYDATQVLGAFGTVIRDEVELSRLSEQLLGVVEETIQPSKVWLWVRESGSPATAREV